MPTYEYKCTNSSCEHQFEIWQEVGSAPPECPECQSAVRKIFHPVSVHFKGSGFYITDSKGDGKKPESKTESKTEATSEASSEPSGESKSDGDKSSSSDSSSSTTAPAKTDSKPAAEKNTAATK